MTTTTKRATPGPTSPPHTRRRVQIEQASKNNSTPSENSTSNDFENDSTSTENHLRTSVRNSNSTSSSSNNTNSSTSSYSITSSSTSSTNPSARRTPNRDPNHLNNRTMHELGSDTFGSMAGLSENNNNNDDDNDDDTRTSNLSRERNDRVTLHDNHNHNSNNNDDDDDRHNRDVMRNRNHFHDHDYDDDEDNVVADDDFPTQDITLYSPSVAYPSLYEPISIETLETEDPDVQTTVLHVQFLRLKSGQDVSNKHQPSYMTYNRNRKENKNKMYSRMLLCRDLSSSDGRVIYIIEGKNVTMSDENQCNNLWGKGSQFRANGVVSVGRCFTLVAPDPIVSYIQNDVPIIKVDGGLVPLKDPKLFNEVPINHQINSNITRSYCINDCNLKVRKLTINKTKCSGLFCDKQACFDGSRSTENCGCYQMNTRGSSLAISFTLKVANPFKNVDFKVDKFTSLQFWSLFLTEPINSTASAVDFDNNDRFMTIYSKIQQMIELVNDNNGWTVIGWYRKGESADANATEEKQLVDAAFFQLHVSRIVPSNIKVLDSQRFKSLMFDFNDENITVA